MKMIIEKKNTHYNFIDLFAGAGGLSEGFIRAGFTPLAHVEMNKYASKTLETRSAYYYLKSKKKTNIYYNYLKGLVSREQLLDKIPDDVLGKVFCETMSDKSLPRLFRQIDEILNNNE